MIQSVDIPEVLQAASETGIPTAESIAEALPGTARSALDALRRETPAGSTGERLTNFFQTQVGARSLAPREGDDPDAVLSRVEAAVRQGDLSTALSTLDVLPETGQAIFSDWIAEATKRRDALDAAEALSDLLNVN
ncbi:MAG: hypothetical protein AAFY03_00705 [Pseudomonadota bacterium]